MASLLENENNQSIADRTRSKTPCTEQHSENHYTNGLTHCIGFIIKKLKDNGELRSSFALRMMESFVFIKF